MSVRFKAVASMLVIALLSARGNASPSAAVDAPVKDLMRRYEEVEGQLDRSVHYQKTDVAGDRTTVEQAWFNGAGDPIKVATEQTGPGSRELTEYFADDFDQTTAMFILTRKETAQPDGATQVEESRKYLSGGKVVRELRKSGRFEPGAPLDTVKLPNAIVDVAKEPNEKRSEQEQYEFLTRAGKIASELQNAGPPAVDPFANVKGDSEKFRVIHGTASPDGRYAIALGFAGEEAPDWEQLSDPDFPGTYSNGDYDFDEEDPKKSETGKMVNYVVDLTTRKILGTTGCGFFGTRRRYNHRECSVAWSPNSRNFVQLARDKWNYVCCRAAQITDGPKLAGTVDLGKYAEKTAASFLKTHKHGKYRGSIAIYDAEVTDAAVIDLTVTGQSPTVPNKGDIYFSVTEQLRLRETRAGLRVETVNVR
ncbi:MAG TPA: hypothetical protein VF511_09630, partial [Chthoniobacterales bacterium]